MSLEVAFRIIRDLEGAIVGFCLQAQGQAEAELFCTSLSQQAKIRFSFSTVTFQTPDAECTFEIGHANAAILNALIKRIGAYRDDLIRIERDDRFAPGIRFIIEGVRDEVIGDIVRPIGIPATALFS